MRGRDERGLTLIELLVTVSILSIMGIAVYSMLISGTRSSNTARDIARQSQEARLGFNRMVRDTREATKLTLATPTSFKVEVDFNQDGAITAAPSPNPNGDYEDLTFVFDEAAGTITLNGSVLMTGVSKIGTQALFTYSSNRLEHDSNGDGVVTLAELQTAQDGGALLSSPLENSLSDVTFSLKVTSGTRVTEFYSQAELRNRR